MQGDGEINALFSGIKGAQTSPGWEGGSLFQNDTNKIYQTGLILKYHHCRLVSMNEGLDGGGGGSGIYYSLKIQPIIRLIKILGYSLK